MSTDKISKIKLKNNSDKRIKFGHLWVYSNEIQEHLDLEIGSIVEVIDFNNRSYGFAFYNPHSLIAIRLLKTFQLPNLDFFINRIKTAKELRERCFKDIEMVRLIFGESDLLPGLIIDKYSDYFAIQILSAGMEKNKELVVKALLANFPNTKGIVEKNDTKLRENEGLSLESNLLYGEIPNSFVSNELGIKLKLSILS